MNDENSEHEFAQLDAYATTQLTEARATLTEHIDTEARPSTITTAAGITARQDGTATASDYR
jgi:hypothetical protein